MKKNFIHYLYPSVLRGVIGLLIVVPLTTYYLEPKDFGVVAIITVFSGFVTPLSSVGVGWVLSGNYYRLSSRERGELIFNMLCVGLLLRTFWVVIFGATAFSFLPIVIKSYENIFLLFFWIFLLGEWFNSVWEVTSYTMVLQKKGRMYALLDMTQILSNLIVLIVCLVIFRLKTISLVLAYLGIALGGFMFSAIYIRKYIVPRIRKKWIKEIIKVGFPTIPHNLFEIISNSIERFLIARWIGLSQLGIYSHSLQYRRMFMMPFKAFSRSCSPEILEGIIQKDETKINFIKDILKKWFGLLTLVGAGIILFSEDIIRILTHGKFTKAAPLVSLWFILILVYSFGLPYMQFLLANKKIKFIFWSDMIIGAISWGIIALFVKSFGIFGATISIILYFLMLYSVKKMYSIRLGSLNFEGYHFIFTLILLLCLMFFVNIFSLSLLFKAIVLLCFGCAIHKYHNLFSVLRLRTLI